MFLPSSVCVIMDLQLQKIMLRENFVVCIQIIDMAKCYHAEVEWRDKKYVPGTVEEHLKISARSSGCMHLASQGFISMGDVTTTEAIEWAFTYPKIIRAVCIIARLANDIMSHKVYLIIYFF